MKPFRRTSPLGVAAVALLLLTAGWSQPSPASTQEAAPGVGAADSAAIALQTADTQSVDPRRSVDEAKGTIRRVGRDVWRILPKVGIALAILAIATVLARLVRVSLRRLLSSWARAEALGAIGAVLLWLLALGLALSVLAGDVRALAGSIGLFGLALSWALQTPIESFTGWLLNSFRGYYRRGDRILVGDVFGDVLRIDFLTTTIWEAGGLNKSVQGAQPTGAIVTFPNAEILRSSVVNYTRDFPFVWDELSVGLAPETDLRYASEVLRGVADRVVGESMAAAAERYRSMLSDAGLTDEAAARPEVYLSPADAWTTLTLRYLVPVRERRKWLSRLLLEVAEAEADPEHRGRIVPAVPRYVVVPPPGPTP